MATILLAKYILHYQHRPTDGAVFTQLNTETHRKVQIHTVTRRECPRGQGGGRQRYKASISLTSALDGGWVVNATHRPFCPRERASVFTAVKAGWAPEPVWTVTVVPTWPQTPSPTSPQRIAVPTAISLYPTQREVQGKCSYSCSRLSNVLTGQDCHVVIGLRP